MGVVSIPLGRSEPLDLMKRLSLYAFFKNVETILCPSNLGLNKVKMLNSFLEGIYLLEVCLSGIVEI